jgi:hypothetical protein
MSQGIRTHWRAYFVFGLVFTWVAGIGRYWDNPRAGVWQHIGLGSVAYVFVLAMFIWLLLAPLRPKNWSYKNVLLFLTLTAPPALLYAIPVEKFMTLENARTTNVWFLAIVSVWRVALLVRFLHRTGGLSAGATAVAALLPITIIMLVITELNLEHVVFSFMGGLRDEQRTGNDDAFMVVFILSIYSLLAAPVLLIAYFVCIFLAWRRRRADVSAKGEA